MIGQTVSHYKIVEKLGEGGMGAVYRAEDLKLDRTVALKFVLSNLGDDFSGQERLMREAKACAALNHPNITTLYDFGEDGSSGFIVMEFVEGTTLQEALWERSFSTDEVIRIGIQAADALGAAHAKGILHRDLKPANIMLDHAGRVKVMDFGLAKFAESSFITQTGATLGTAAYMSPEQVRGEALTLQSDVYSLGVVLYQLATGVTPYAHAHHLAVMYAITNEEPASPRDHNPALSPELEAVILKAMSKNPSKRYKSCAEMEAALRELAGHPVHLAKPRASFLQERWFTVGVPIIVFAAVAAIVLVAQGPLMPGGVGAASPQMTAAAHYDDGYLRWAEAESLAALGEQQRAAARYVHARESLERSLEMDNSVTKVWSLLASVNIKLGNYEAAIFQNERAIELADTNTEAYYNLGYALEETGNTDRALAEYAHAVQRDSFFTAAYSAMANLLIEEGKPREALTVLERALEKTPDSPHAFLIHKNFGKAYLAMGRHEDAVTHLIKSYQLEPSWPETTALLARTYDEAGLREEARQMWGRYLELETDEANRAAARERLAEN